MWSRMLACGVNQTPHDPSAQWESEHSPGAHPTAANYLQRVGQAHQNVFDVVFVVHVLVQPALLDVIELGVDLADSVVPLAAKELQHLLDLQVGAKDGAWLCTQRDEAHTGGLRQTWSSSDAIFNKVVVPTAVICPFQHALVVQDCKIPC